MKNYNFLLVFFIFLTSTINLSAQKDVTKFLGIPVDGSKTEFIKNLKLKGFTSSPDNKEILVGEFNGANVNIHIATNNNKVSRIMVSDVNTLNEAGIKIRFNKLCQQFQKNEKYIKLSEENYEISEQEDISYQMTVKNIFYDALFYQKTEIETVSNEVAIQIKESLLTKYTKDQIEHPTDEIKKEIEQRVISYIIDKSTKKPVWFRIFKHNYDEYYISIYYDNEYNRANGEDL